MKSQNKYFYENVRKDRLRNNIPKENWTSIDLEDAMLINETLFDLWLIFEKISVVLGSYGQVKDGKWDKINVDPVDYRISLMLLRRTLQDFRFMSLKEMENELLSLGLELDERRLRDRLDALVKSKLVLEYNLNKLKKNDVLYEEINEKYNLKTKILYAYNLDVAQFLMENWSEENQENLNLVHSTDLQTVLNKCALILNTDLIEKK